MLWGSYRRPVLKIFFIFVFLLVSLMIGITVALQFPSIQTEVSHKVAAYLSKKIGLPITIGYVNIYWLNTIQLKDVEIRDLQNNILIAARKTRVTYDLSTLIRHKDITFNKAFVEGADVRIVRNVPDGEFNINKFVDGINNLGKKNSEDTTKGKFTIKEIELQNSSFTLSDPLKDTLVDKFNYNQFRLQHINVKAEDLEAQGKDFKIQINELSCLDSATQFDIHRLSGAYQITDQSMVFRTFNIDAGKSHLEYSMVFQFDSIQQMSAFNDSVTITADIKNSKIFSGDLGFFVDKFKQFEQDYQLDGFFNGQISRFDVSDFNLAFGELSHIRGKVSIDGLPDFTNSFIDLTIVNSLLNPEDLKPYLGEKIINSINKFGRSSFNGQFIGFPNDFVSDAIFYTQIGTVDTDINLKVSPENNLPRYSGHLNVSGFDLGKFVGNEKLYQNIDLKGKIEGQGLTPAEADFYLDATIDNFGFLGYNYQNIITDGRFSSQIFNGYISLSDPNLNFELNGNIDLTKENEKINITAELDTAILENLHITSKPTSLSTTIQVDLQGLKPDEITGQFFADRTYISYDGRSSVIDNLKLISEKKDGNNYLELSSDNMDCHLDGQYKLTEVIKDLNRLIQEYELIIENNRDTLNNYWTNLALKNLPAYNLDYNFTLFNINPFLHLFAPDIYISKNTNLTGHIIGGDQSEVSLNTSLDTLIYGNFTFLDNIINLKAIKESDTSLINASLDVTSAKQFGNHGNGTNNLFLKAFWKNDSIDFSFNLSQKDQGNNININSAVTFGKKFTRFKFKPSDLIVLGERWHFSPDNNILIKGKEFQFSNFMLSSNNQFISLDGFISEDTSKSFRATVHNFELENINPLLPKKFKGILNSETDISRLYNKPIITSNLSVDSLIFESFLVGNIQASSNWEPHDQKMLLQLRLFDTRQNKLIDLHGNYFTKKERDRLDLTADFNNANLNVIEPFYSDLISNLQGKASGTFNIKGSFKNPVLQGEGVVQEGSITINYLKTTYKFNGNIIFTKNEIGVRNIVLKDKYNNTGTVNGGIIHDYFRNVRYNIQATFDHLLVLNTSFNDNDLYYGTAFGTGSLQIVGQEQNINMKINATTNQGTRFFIPLTGSSEVAQENFIQFIDFSKQKNLSENEEENDFVRLQGIKLDFDLEVTPEAYTEIIFDQKAGDIIRGRGNGKLNMTINTQGEFNMFGNFVFESGAYNFTLYNVINKEFSIEPNSRISWSGDPYGAQMDVVANYKQLASLAPIVQDSALAQDPDIKRKYPTTVELELTGPILSPNINFDISLEDYPQNLTVSTTVSAFESEIHSNEQELKRQVFSLIMLRTFAPKGSFSVGAGSIGNSVSEFISNQLSYWVSQLDENLEIDLDLGTIDQSKLNTFQYRLSYTFNDGRLRITRAGNITSNEETNDISNIIGDWTLEYLLTENGEYRAKMFNRFNNYNNLYPNTQRNTATTGFSFMYTKSFNNFRDLFKEEENKRKKKEKNYIEFDEGVLPSRKDFEGQPESDAGTK